MNYGGAIVDAIHGSRVMVLVLSSHANNSRHIPNEIERAVSNGVAILPFRIEDVRPAKSLDLFIGSVHWLDALTPPVDRHLDRLAESVSKLLPDRTASPSPPPPVPSPPPLPLPKPSPNWYKPAAVAAAIVGALILGWSLSTRNTGRVASTDSYAPGATTAPRSAMTGGQDIVGCWRWSNHPSIVIRSNGTLSAVPFTGEWRHNGGRSYTLTWPEPVDTLTMSSNRQQLRGANQYGVTVNATRVSGGPDVAGSWRWGGVIPVVIASNGSVSMGALSGTWELADPGQRLYRVTWPKIQDAVTLSDDLASIKGMNQYGVAVSGTRTGCP